ncbi:MAG: thioesterase family protein [Verrucomicrobiota bacterium]|jgi:acyl-CoA thioester hydrolase|nr:thioesterase family protein [Verrucomicrobiota bacterium]MEC9326716.1 thioesterase family protein [Verrucomicrobiota bacterium]
MSCHFKQRRKAVFSETDLAGIVHFASFFPYMEDCEHSFYRSLDYSVTNMVDDDGINIGWPRVNVSCEYLKPLHFEDEFEIQLLVSDITDKTIKYEFNFFDDEKALLAKGSVVVVCVKFTDSGMKSSNIPDSIRNSINKAINQ